VVSEAKKKRGKRKKRKKRKKKEKRKKKGPINSYNSGVVPFLYLFGSRAKQIKGGEYMLSCFLKT
jgi:hypothetical protein